jgi:uncharacterized protein with PIN domain
MSEELSLEEYRSISTSLPWIEPLQVCCSSPMEKVQVEPLQGRNTLEVERSSIVRCPDCGKKYWSRWD